MHKKKIKNDVKLNNGTADGDKASPGTLPPCHRVEEEHQKESVRLESRGEQSRHAALGAAGAAEGLSEAAIQYQFGLAGRTGTVE